MKITIKIVVKRDRGIYSKEVEAEPINLGFDGYRFAIRNDNSKDESKFIGASWQVVELSTGYAVILNCDTKKEAKEKAIQRITKNFVWFENYMKDHKSDLERLSLITD